MRTLFTLIVGLAFQVYALAQESSIVINGKTNVNSFKCVNTGFQKAVHVYEFSEGKLPNIQIDINKFYCKNKMMTSDFKKTLHFKEFPTMSIKFLKFKRRSNMSYQALVEVKLMNKVKKYEMDFVAQDYFLVAKDEVKFSDFGIQPPKKMGGMVVVQDNLDLNVSLKYK